MAHLVELNQHDLALTLSSMHGVTDTLHTLELSRLHSLFTERDKTAAVNRLISFDPKVRLCNPVGGGRLVHVGTLSGCKRV